MSTRASHPAGTKSFIDLSEGTRVLEATVPKVAGAMRAVDDGDAKAIGHWTVRDVAAHLTDVAHDQHRITRGEGSVYSTTKEIPDVNDQRLRARENKDLHALADEFETQMTSYISLLKSIEGDPIVSWAELQIPQSAVVASDIGELLVHGFDITHAEGKPWPIDPHAAGLSLKGISPVTMHYVDKEATAGVRAVFDVRIRGQWQLHFAFDDGKLKIEEPSSRRVDVHLSADPVAFMLVGYGRVSHWGPLFKGQLLSWGRKPLLALKFPTFLKNP
ncbi:MAG TPA: maleylpyruvate isomerase family mycothiol-dependent enzyme [Actinomycetota bacterium]|nr:maleylpyruvate isomerase family mycothiol-dependent enzyme [Actinomycetota bacterium]